MGCTLGVLMEGGALPWGDGPAAIKMLKKVAGNDAWGLIIGNGSAFAGQALGVDRIPAVKTPGPARLRSPGGKRHGLSYATSPMGGDHTSGYTVAVNLLKPPGGAIPSRRPAISNFPATSRSPPRPLTPPALCLFVAFAVLDHPDALQCIVDMINARYGLTLSTDDVTALGKKVLHDELSFNRAAGFTPAHDRLPEFF